MRVSNSSKGALEEPLTRREMDILARLAQGHTNPEIAQLESLASSSVKWYVNQILGKLRVTSRGEAVSRALDLGLLKKEPEEALALSPHNLPRQLMSFIGREREIAELIALVQANPLVTVTGSGGVGKTRLALRAAEELLSSFPNGVWLVELAPLSDPDLVPQAVMTALRLTGSPELSPSSRLSQYLHERKSLLVLDNCEHLVEAAAALAHELLHACPRLSILTTSRELLGVQGEIPYRCPSLSLPVPGRSLESINQSEAVRLFAERARGASPGFIPVESNIMDIARICQRLDGIPLAIELAAARLRLLSITQIAERLEDVFSLLAGASRSELRRHRTLRAAIEWSYELLSDPERTLMQRLSVFAGSWNLEAAEAVCADPPGGLLPTTRVLDLLGRLVDKSMVEPLEEGPGGGRRYRMLGTIRQFAREKLLSGEEEKLRDRHLDYYLSFCLDAEPHIIAREGREWKERVDAELDNLRLALDWSLSGPVEKGLRLAAALQWYWHGRMHLNKESCDMLERLLATEAAGPKDVRMQPSRRVARGKALNVLGHRQRDPNEDEPTTSILFKEAEEIFRNMGEEYRIDWLTALSMTGEKDLGEVLDLMRATGDRFYTTYVLWYLILVMMRERDIVRCRAYIEESLYLNQAIGYIEGEEVMLRNLARLEFWEGNIPKALELLDAAYECLKASGAKGKAHFGFGLRADIALVQGDYPKAIRYRQAILAAYREIGLPFDIVNSIEFLALTAWASGDDNLTERYIEQARHEAERLGLVDYNFSLMSYLLARIAIGKERFELASTLLKNANIQASTFSFSQQYWLLAFGILAAAQGQASRAAVIFGVLQKQPWLLNISSLRERLDYEHAIAAARSALGPADFSAAWAEGRAMTNAQAIQYVLGSEPRAGIGVL